MTILKGSTYIAVVPLTAIVSQNLTNLFGFTKYLNLNLNLNLISLMLFPINLVFQMSDFRYEIKTELKLRYLLSDLKHLT